jgi:hypothetical protein
LIGSPFTVARAARVIDHQLAALQRRRRVAGRPAQQGAQAGQQLFGDEGLGEVIVGPGIKARHLLAPLVAGSQDQHRESFALLAPALEHAHAVDLWQAEVEDHGVIGFGLAEELAVFAVCGEVDGIAGL